MSNTVSETALINVNTFNRIIESFDESFKTIKRSTKLIIVTSFSVTTGDLSAVFPGMDQNFSKEIEDESNTYFQGIYNQPPGTSMSIDEVLEMLKRFKDSVVKKERVSRLFIR